MQPAPPPQPRTLLLLGVFEALEAWLSTPSDGEAANFGRAVVDVGTAMGIEVLDLEVNAPPLAALHAPAGLPDPAAEMLRDPRGGLPLGSMTIRGDERQARALATAIARLVAFARERARADTAAQRLGALEGAVRGIGDAIDPDHVLQRIVDQARDLVPARYAAIGIVDADGVIERFITSGIADAERIAIGPLPRGLGLLGLLITESRTVRVADIAAHPAHHGFPANHPAMRSFLGAPITTGGVAIGRLYLTDKVGADEFSADDEVLVETFALHAGLAIERARLHEQVRRLAIVDERDRISRDLHDSSIQAIYAQTLALDDVPELVADDPEEARRRVDAAIDALHAVISDIRNFIFGLRPVLLESGDLADGLAQVGTELHRSSGIEVSVEVLPAAAPLAELPIELVAELLTVTREALSNIARHAQAVHASVTLDGSPSELRLTIADDGRGFDANRPIERGHHGIANMRARITALAGTLIIDSDLAGTRIIMTVPRRHSMSFGSDH